MLRHRNLLANLEQIRLSFAHVEADESGSMNQWLGAAPESAVVHGMTGVMVSLNDLADRPPRALGGSFGVVRGCSHCRPRGEPP